jgi:dynein heavy chain 2
VVNKVKTYMDDPRDIDYVLKLKQMQDYLKGKENKPLNALEEIIRKVDKVQVQVDCLSDERSVSNKVTFRFDKFKEDVFKSIVEIKENIGATIKDNLNEDLQRVDSFILGTQNFLKKKVASTGELEELKREYAEVTKKFNEVDQDIKGLDKKIKIINDFGFKGTNHINLANLRRKWDNFAVKFGCFTYTIKSSEGQIKKKVKGELEKMSGEIDKFYAKIQSVDLKSTDNMTKDQEVAFSNKLKEIRREWEEIQKVLGDSLANADQYEVDLSDMKSLQAIRDYFKGPFAQWMVYFEFLAGLEKMEKEQWITFKYNVYDFQKYIIEWEEKVRSANSSSTRFVRDQCNLYLEIWPALKSMIGEGFQRNHWTDLFALINLPKNRPFNEITFGEILGKKDVIQKKIEEIKFLAARAQGEVALREALADLQSWCENTQFVFYEFTDQQKIILNLVKEWTDILTEVGDNQAILQNISDSKFSMNFTDQIETFQNKLGGLDDMLLKLNLIQRKWIYLEPVFGRGALPNEQGRFRRIDDEFRSIIQALNNEPLVVTLSSIPSVSETLDMLLDQLERCQKALNSYLEEKRNVMPRFYFLGDDDLLELLGQSQNVEVIHSHLKKLFSGIVKLKVNEENKESFRVEQIASSKAEQVKLLTPVVLTKDVESWLGNLSDAMNDALSGLLKQSIKNTDNSIEKYPGQLLEISDSVHFTKKAETGIQAGKLVEFKKEMNEKLSSLTSSKAKLKGLSQLKLKNLILDTVHNITVVENLIAKNVRALDEWEWFRQLKYFFNKSEDVMVSMGKAEFNYSYEYQGNVSKLVHTPLTDKCYLTLTQGMMMGYGGNPYGPAGTGKTESVKALGYAFGRQVLVFNCDEGIDYQSMGRIFIGLIKCGAWGCFDEFNRLKEEQLSAISQQIQVIQYAIKEGIPKIHMMGQDSTVNRDAGIFVTMNPAGKAYGGRSKLPDNLKQLFRPVAMSQPDNEMIAEVLLYSEGFLTARKLSKKIVSVFVLSKQLLSAQQHYDWGLRALKTILVVGGQLIQKVFEQGSAHIDEKEEASLLVKSIRVNTMSKLTFADTKKFENLMNNIFMGVKIEDVKYEELTNCIKETLTEMNLSFVERQVNKIKQFYEAVRQRMGIVLVGPSGCSKTTIWKVLKGALKKMGQEVKVHILNPKSVSRTDLLGFMNNDTREFQDGILTSLARKVVKEQQEIMNWIVCDGDVDPEWIESLNSVLDDNHLLTLPNGERISLGSNVNFIFETHELRFASPATVSRMGMMYLNNEDINTQSIIDAWIKSLPHQTEQFLKPRLQKDLEGILDILINLEQHTVIETTRVGQIEILLSHLVAVTNEKEYAIGLYRGLASGVRSDKRDDLIAEVSKIAKTSITEEDLVVDYAAFDPKNMSLDKFLPTTESRAIIGNLRPWVTNNQPFIIAGPEGCGKETLIRAAFHELNEKVRIVTIYSNSQLDIQTSPGKALRMHSEDHSGPWKTPKAQRCHKTGDLHKRHQSSEARQVSNHRGRVAASTDAHSPRILR